MRSRRALLPPRREREAARASSDSSTTVRDCAMEMKADARVRLGLVHDRHEFLIEVVKKHRKVAHLGCTASPYTLEAVRANRLLHQRLLPLAEIVGFDVERADLELLARLFPEERFVHGDLVSRPPVEERGGYDLVLAGEVLEHVPNAGSFLHSCGELLTPEGVLCITVPNACSPKIGLRSLVGRESVHPDHHTYYGPRTLVRALAAAGFEVTALYSYFAPSGRVGHAANAALRAAHRVFAGPVGDGLIAIAQAGPPRGEERGLSGAPAQE